MIRGRFVAACLGLAVFFGHGAAVAADDAAVAGEFVGTVVSEAVTAFSRQALSLGERADLVRERVLRYSSAPLVSKQVLGRYWARMSEAEQAEFQALLVDYVVAVWSESLGDVSAGTTVVTQDATQVGDTVTLNSLLLEPGEAPSAVQWVVVFKDGRPIITDVSADGVSIVVTLQADFTSVLRANGGKTAPLFDAMRKKIAPQ